ncbi:MAG: FAD-dependent oxidoreductase [Lachnospiraceae bacterium]|nr:FAD-dependent oxidoreductase [Lachnospiraceae bacterium]
MTKDLVIIGGGPAGLAAAVAARKAGVQDLLILERDNRLGGILNQCIHNGFGLHTFKEELTGPEYAERFIRQAAELQIPYKLSTMVVDLRAEGPDRVVTAMSRKDGIYEIRAKSVVLAMGCRERSRGALNIPGYRPAGIYTAGTAQRYVNIEGRMPGRSVVILGSGDIGLIMARRMTLEGAKVQCVAELQPYSGGLKRNIAQCLNDFDIPLLLSHTVVDIKGKERVESVTIAEVDEHLKPIPGTETEYPCDTLLLSCGLLPENELSGKLGVPLSPITGGPLVNESFETGVSGVFACGNVLHVHDLVDYVSEEASAAGEQAAKYLTELSETSQNAGQDASAEKALRLRGQNGVRYTVPATIRPDHMADTQVIRFRVGANFRDATIRVSAGDQVLLSRKKNVLAPGEMEQLVLKKADLEQLPAGSEIVFEIAQ